MATNFEQRSTSASITDLLHEADARIAEIRSSKPPAASERSLEGDQGLVERLASALSDAIAGRNAVLELRGYWEHGPIGKNDFYLNGFDDRLAQLGELYDVDAERLMRRIFAGVDRETAK